MTATRPKVITSGGEPVAHFDLDAVEVEANQVPFTFTLGGELFTMLAPEDADWQVMTDTDRPDWTRAFMQELLKDDYERFAKYAVPIRKLNKLIEACTEHYGITPGESKASARSSRSTRRR
ncbi:hypothetical protein AB0395_39730 [Streptosporangium sp. NPDC051023]|uniref:hypothetical protein n=1 Tax=Streptosporangium sp. NPDC051023 TaxID=3155410 RepID=UPI00344BF5B3